jgi:LmbE family N-acetylglucosaminyl deacetylase
VKALVTALLLICTPGFARMRSVPHPQQQRILWIGAHPDDESLLAPILGPACREQGQVCSFLVFTHGERGDCSLPGGCGDLGSLRSMEMQSAADFFHAHLTLWNRSDVMTDVIATWSAETGSRGALIARIRSVIAAEEPTIIYTFDPNHGSTCHPAHRAVGELVIEAVDQSKIPVMFIETVVGDGDSFSSATAGAIVVRGDWNYLIDDLQIHASQFSPDVVDLLRRTPTDQQVVWLATAPAQKYSCGR